MEEEQNWNGKRFDLLFDLLDGKIVTPKDAIQRYRMYRLAAEIFTLRHKMHVPIETLKHGKFYNGSSNSQYAGYRITPSLLKKQRERFGF